MKPVESTNAEEIQEEAWQIEPVEIDARRAAWAAQAGAARRKRSGWPSLFALGFIGSILLLAIAVSLRDSAVAGFAMLSILALIGIAFYFLPTIVAAARSHHQGMAIFVVNLFLGWTFLGWVVALAWAFTATGKKE